MPLVKPLVTTLIGAFAGGMAASILGAKTYGMGMNGIFGMLIFGDTTFAMVAGVIVGMAVAFVLAWIVGFDESKFKPTDN